MQRGIHITRYGDKKRVPLVGERVRWRCVYPQHVRVRATT